MPDTHSIKARLAAGELMSAEELLPVVYDELRRLAASKIGHERPGQTLQATALVHEAYVRLIGGQSGKQWDSRGHFFVAAAEAMRRILIERVRRKRAMRHGGEFHRQPITCDVIAEEVPADEILAVHESLDRFEAIDPVKARLIKLRYFAGMTIHQAGEALGLSPATADRYWAYARVWLHSDLKK